MTPAEEAANLLQLFGLDCNGGRLVSFSPIDGKPIGRVSVGDPEAACARAAEAFARWRLVPAPRRGEFVRLLGEWLREAKPLLAKLVTLESGKILQESLGEVQEMIDICDFAVGLSRQLYGLTIASERPNHRMMEQWHPLGPVLVISAFNFPVAVWAWNAALALVCGNPVIWKPSEKTPLCAEAVMVLVRRAADRFGDVPDGLVQLVQGEREVGEKLVDDPRIALVSATGSTAMGRAVGPRVAQRFGRVLLELGGLPEVLGGGASRDPKLGRTELEEHARLFVRIGSLLDRTPKVRDRGVGDSLRERAGGGLAKRVDHERVARGLAEQDVRGDPLR